MKTRSNFSALLQAFFMDRLMRQRQVSPETIASYRDAFCLLFRFVQQRLNKTPSVLEMQDLDAPLIVAFLCWLENERGNCARTRNARLAAIHSFFKYAAFHDPAHSGLIQRVLAIPGKRYDRVPVQYLTRPETEALLAAPDQTTWAGRRDLTLLLLAVQAGLRVSELVGLDCQHIVLGNGAHLRCKGKGRKESAIALWLGHETLETVDVYVHADIQMKEQALAKTAPLDVPPGRYHPDDQLLDFLKSL
jgi:integrase/recombinase XerD